ncbi:MAG: SH3 domain-containing protein [Eubacterium sp.]
MKKFKNLLSIFMSFVLLVQIIALPSAYGIASDTTTTDSDNEKSYESMLNAIVGENDMYPNEDGIWINEFSQEYFLSILTNLSDQSYTVNQDGYLTQNVVNEDTFNTYDEKLKELIDGNKTIIVSISETYDAYNEELDESYSIMLEDDEFTLLFEKDNDCSITVLNYYHYAEHQDKFVYEDEDEFDEEYFYSDSELMNKFLEVFYQDVDFVGLTADEQTQKELDELLIDDNEVQYKTPETEVVSRARSYSSISEFDAAMYGIESNSAMALSLDEEDNYSNSGILVDSDSQDIILNYLNTHCIYTYSIDKNGYLICDNVEKDNPNLDCQGETEIDKEIAFVIESGLNIIINVSDSYYTNENGILEKVYFSSDEYTKSFLSDEENAEILYLNIAYFNLDMGYNPATSDRFVKNLFPDEFVPHTYSTTKLYGETGKMNTARTVYFGPSSSDYATVGSVDNGEDIVVMGKNAGWYFIAYIVGSTSTFKSGYVPVSTVSSVSGTIDESDFTGGHNYSDSELTVKSCYLFDNAINSGTIYSGEGFTELQRYYEDGKYISLVEFSTPSGTKRGFVNSSSMHISTVNNSTVARVIADSSPAYAGTDSSYVKLGGVYKNEFVAVLAVSNGYAFVEYNTTSGRKRGYVRYSDLSNYCVRSYSKNLTHQSLKKATKELTVYGGPNSDYASIGTIFNQEVVSFIDTERNYSYIEYTTSNGAKRGYVQTASLTAASLPTIPSIPTYTNFTSGTYGKSGLGKDLKWYKIGSGSNVVFAVFEQHGWEDAWAADGIELVNIAKTMMSKLSAMNQSTFNDWTIYVIPYANPDGITDGYTNNGPGRCTVSKKVDMNRCWPGNFSPSYTSRNYTGDTSLGAPEALSLAEFISDEIKKVGSGNTTVLDIHGWLNKTYGNSQVGSYFAQQFGFGHSNSHGNGYLETWAYLNGSKSCLIEFPMPSNSASITSNDFAGKLTNGLVNYIKNSSGSIDDFPEGGTLVNDLCQIKTTSSVNVRSGPGTSYSIVTSLTNGTKVTRIKKAVATANGYTWDKISLSDGTVGYIATNYLSVINDDYGYIYSRSYDEIAAVKAYLKYETALYDDKAVNKQYNWELTGAVEEYQKAYSLSVKDGYLNDETLKKMGFSINTNGKIVNNTYYQKYLIFAKQYMHGPYIDDAKDDNGNPDPNYYYFNLLVPKFDADYEDIKTRGNNSRKEMKDDEYQEKETKLVETRNKVKQASSMYSSVMKNGSLALGRFVDENNFGKPLKFNDVSGVFKASNNLNSLYQRTITRNMRAAEHLTEYVDSARFSMETYVGVDMGLNISANTINSLDWFLAMNGFVFGSHGNVSKNNNVYTMNLTIDVRDYYDWAKDESEEPMTFPLFIDFETGPNGTYTVLESVNEIEMNDLHRSGLGENFESSGSISLSFSWEKGQTYDNIKGQL